MNKSLTDYLYDVAGYHHNITTYTKIVDNKEQYYIHFLDHYFEKSMIFQKFRRLKIDLEWILKIADSIALNIEEIKSDPFYGYVYQLNFDWNNTISKLNDKQIVSRLIKNKNPIIRRLIAKNGTNQHRQQLLDNNEKDLLVLCKIAEFGTDSQRRKLISILDKNDIGFVKAEVLYLIDKIIKFGNEKQKQHYINHKNYEVRCKVAQFGSDEQRNQLMNDASKYVLCSIVQFGNDAQRQQLINHESNDVRTTIALHGNDKQRDFLMNDESKYVLCAIIEAGNDEQRQRLINHESDDVRAAIAHFGNDDQREYLMNDKSSKVLCTIIQFGNDEQRQRLINHETDDVRAAIAHFGNDKQRSQLIGDKNMNVVCNIIKFGNDEHKNLTISHYSYNEYIYRAICKFGNEKQKKLMEIKKSNYELECKMRNW